MASTIGTPRSGRLCFAASALFLSVFGRPVAGSFGSLSQTSAPHSAPPQLVMRTWLSLSAVYQVPSGSAARAGPAAVSAVADSTTVESQSAKRNVFIKSLYSCGSRGRDHSRGGANCLVAGLFSIPSAGGATLLNASLPKTTQAHAARFRFDSSHYLNHHSNLLRIIGVLARGNKGKRKRTGTRRRQGIVMARFEILDSNMAPLGEGPASGDMLFELGMMYSVGRDVPVDLVSAHKWFNLAAVKGNAEAIRLRREIANQMSDAEIAVAQRAARDWLRGNAPTPVPAPAMAA